MELQNCMTDMLSTLASGFGDKALMLVDKDGTPAGHILGTEMVGAMEYEHNKHNRVPWGYTELLYIHSTGGQYINTGITPSVNTELLIELEHATGGLSTFLFGNYNGTGKYCVYYYYDTLRYELNWACADSRTDINVATADVRKTIRIYSDGTTSYMYINGTLVASGDTSSDVSGNRPFTIFRGYNSVGNIQTGLNMKIYSCELKDRATGNMLAHLIPAKRNSDNVVGMFDLVSNTFLTNAGTGTFSYGEL